MRAVVVSGMLVGMTLALAAPLTGCSDQEEACNDGVAALCAKACDCSSTSGLCTVQRQVNTLGFLGLGDCHKQICSGLGSVDWSACEAAVADATCIDNGVAQPAVCEGWNPVF